MLLLPPKLSERSIQEEVIHLVKQVEDDYLSEDDTGAESFGREAMACLPSLTSYHRGQFNNQRDNELPKTTEK